MGVSGIHGAKGRVEREFRLVRQPRWRHLQTSRAQTFGTNGDKQGFDRHLPALQRFDARYDEIRAGQVSFRHLGHCSPIAFTAFCTFSRKHAASIAG